MSLIEKIKEQLLEARKAKNELAKNVLSVALGDIQTQQGKAAQNGAMTEQQCERIVQKMINSNQETMDAMTKKLRMENEILAALLPKTLSRLEMKNYLFSWAMEQIKAAKSDGQATGVAMKALASLEGSKDGKLVAEIVKELRATESV